MPCHTPRIYVTIANLETCEVLRRLGPHASAGAARVACGALAGQTLTWKRDGQDWIAEVGEVAYSVPAGPEP